MASLLNQFKLVYRLFGQRATGTLNFVVVKPGRKQMYIREAKGTLFESENERQKIEPVPIPIPRAFRNFPDVKTRNIFFS